MSRKKESCLYAEIFSNASFPDALLALDRELAAEAKARGCPRCHGVLDVADYPRKPRGGPFALDEAHSCRLSLCCRRDGCRLRVTPPSPTEPAEPFDDVAEVTMRRMVDGEVRPMRLRAPLRVE